MRLSSPRERALRRIVALWCHEHHDGQIKHNYRPWWLKSPNSNHHLELDIFIPGLGIGFEVNGVSFHSDVGIQERDKSKLKQCKRQGVRLSVIPAWRFNKLRSLAKYVFNQLKSAQANGPFKPIGKPRRRNKVSKRNRSHLKESKNLMPSGLESRGKDWWSSPSHV